MIINTSFSYNFQEQGERLLFNQIEWLVALSIHNFHELPLRKVLYPHREGREQPIGILCWGTVRTWNFSDCSWLDLYQFT